MKLTIYIEQVRSIILHVLSHMSSKWPSSTATWQAYDDALPRNIPSPRYIENER